MENKVIAETEQKKLSRSREKCTMLLRTWHRFY